MSHPAFAAPCRACGDIRRSQTRYGLCQDRLACLASRPSARPSGSRIPVAVTRG